MLVAVLVVFAAAAAAPWITRWAGRWARWILVLPPAALTAYFASLAPAIAAGEVLLSARDWAPALGLRLSFRLDGWSLLFALLVSGFGTLVVGYAAEHLRDHPQLGRFQSFLLLFMASMLGVVLADNLLALFVFWELTSFSSYLLIGFDHEQAGARRAALQALLVTGVGGLALLAGALLLGQAGGSLEITELLVRGEAVRSHSAHAAIVTLVLLAALTKSAQFPFHFWLPDAMAAPTAASAYLHSATMVKAGIYLIARLHPVLGGEGAWQAVVVAGGAVTLFAGAWLAVAQTYMKRLLAYSTVAALGAITLLIGMGSEAAVKAGVVFLVAHAGYKGALFLVAGALEQATGEKDATRLSGLARAMPWTAAAAAIAALSMAGVPPLLGYLAKESLLGAVLAGPRPSWGAALVVLASMALVGVALVAGIGPFLGRSAPQRREVSPWLWAPPLLLALLSVGGGLFPGALSSSLLSAAAGAVLGRPVAIELAHWHGLDAALGLSVLSLGGGALLWAGHGRVLQAAGRLRPLARLGPARAYGATLIALDRAARWQTRLLQSGYLRRYIVIVVASTVGTAGYALLTRGDPSTPLHWTGARAHELAVAILIVAATAMAALSSSRLAAVAAMGAVGYGLALLFVFFSAPDLAMTQIVVETLTVVLFVLAFHHLPRFSDRSTTADRLRDAVVAGAAGLLLTTLVLLATRSRLHARISEYYLENSAVAAHGRNVVNVILVDFRSLDTLGEIVVLATAAVGAYALLKLRSARPEGS
ncbi:MAG TPA: putative monovalent cation/H+ antiporter subunit A [Thermoanaerobaculia bacterium]|nr:putative monovalent cation/H+ antiporter subunit A [Thermoanaerobaculia bacterium]